LLKPGDAALVDDPGYYNMFGNLRLHGVEMLPVPRNADSLIWRTTDKSRLGLTKYV
jgi:DNA-binding transcriptional MocR family regulator